MCRLLSRTPSVSRATLADSEKFDWDSDACAIAMWRIVRMRQPAAGGTTLARVTDTWEVAL